MYTNKGTLFEPHGGVASITRSVVVDFVIHVVCIWGLHHPVFPTNLEIVDLLAV